jgi:hypothetical protein
VSSREQTPVPELLMPARSQAAAIPVTLPTQSGAYRLSLWLESQGRTVAAPIDITLTIEASGIGSDRTCTSTHLDAVQTALASTQPLCELPDDYVDVSEGRLAPIKRYVKRKLLNNFKRAYVDQLSRQQSQVNGQVVIMIQQLAECCAMLDHAIAGIHRRLDQLVTELDRGLPLGTSEAHCER